MDFGIVYSKLELLDSIPNVDVGNEVKCIHSKPINKLQPRNSCI